MTDAHGVTRDQLRAFVERIERLEEEKKTIADDIKDVYGEAKGSGFDTKILKKVIALRKRDEKELTEEEMILDTYLIALNMIPADHEEDRLFDEMVSRANKPNPPASSVSPIAPQLVDSARVEESAAPIITHKHTNIQGSLETAHETPKQVYGDSVAVATAPPSQSVDIPASGDNPLMIDGSDEQRPAASYSPSDDDAIGEVKGRARLPNAVGVEPSSSVPKNTSAIVEVTSVDQDNDRNGAATTEPDDANTGGCHEVNDREVSAAQVGGRLETKPPTDFKSKLRPHCKSPEDCGGYGQVHCGTCLRASRKV